MHNKSNPVWLLLFLENPQQKFFICQKNRVLNLAYIICVHIYISYFSLRLAPQLKEVYAAAPSGAAQM